MLSKVRITGVPEHFNLPWHLAIEEGAFEDRGIDLVWTDTPEGTGKMSKMLREGDTDLAIILTEGLVKAIGDGLDAVICQEYIASPLLWGIHVAHGSAYTEISELQGKVAAVSRFGSGSHLMAYVHAEQTGWNKDQLLFEVVHTLQGAVKALEEGVADYFMWEKFTTQPLVDEGVFRRLDVCPTPWPCFVIACRKDFAEKQTSVLNAILDIINTYTTDFRDIPSIDRTLSNRYGQRLGAVQEWLGITHWSQDQIKVQDLEKVITNLFDLKLLDKQLEPGELLF